MGVENKFFGIVTNRILAYQIVTMIKKTENCLYCGEKMESKTAKKKFCSDLHRVYWNREITIFNYKIYCLRRVDETIFYIGVTRQKLEKRLNSHINEANSISQNKYPPSKKNNEIQKILKTGNLPIIECLHEFTGDIELSLKVESEWIDKMEKTGCVLLNTKTGGDMKKLAKVEIKDKKEGDPAEGTSAFYMKYGCYTYKNISQQTK